MAGDLLHDTFNRVVAAGSWGTADDGHTYTVTTSSNFAVDGARGVIAIPSAGAIQSAISNATSKQDAEVYAELSWSAIPLGAVCQSYLFLRYTDSSNHYRLKIQATLGGHLTLNVTRSVAGTATDIYTTITATTLTAGAVYGVKFRVTGGNTPTLQAKAWLLSGTEPSGWQLNPSAVADPSPYTTAGGYGVRHQQNSGGTNFPTLRVDALDVTDLTSVSPPTPPSSGAARLLVFGDQAGNVARAGYVRAAAVARISATPYRAIHVGDTQYDAAWYREIMQTNGYDAVMEALNTAMIAVPGNHDYQNPVGGPTLTSGSPLAKWVSGTAASAWNNADKLCVPTTAAKANGFYYKASTTGTTGSTEPNWSLAASPGATITDGSVTWTAIWPAQDWNDYVNQRKSGGVYTAYTRSAEPNAAGGGYTRPATSDEFTAMGALYGTQYGAWQSGTDPDNPHQEYGYELVTGNDGADYNWLVAYANTELEYGKRPGDTHTASGYGPASATISGAVTAASRQYAYFQAVFAANQGTPKVLVLHWPPFHSGGEWPKVQPLVSLAIQNGCRIILSGHHHNYQRYVPVDRSFSETTHAGGALPTEAAVLVINGNSGIDLNGLGADPTYSAMFDLRGTTGTMAGGPVNSASSSFYGFTDVQLDRAGFTLTHVVGADSSGTQITYPAASNGSILDTATYTFGAVTAPAAPSLTPSPSTTPTTTAARQFTFSSATGGVTYQRDFNGALATVTSPETVTSSPGSNQYRVRAVLNGVTSAWTTHNWTYNAVGATTGSTYSPVSGDVGYRIRAKVIATNATGSSAPVATAWSEPVSSGPNLVTQPVVSGSLYSGQTVTVTTGDWDAGTPTGGGGLLTSTTLETSISLLTDDGTGGTTGGISYAYQWQIATTALGTWADITGETDNVYTTVSGDIGKYLRANVTAISTDGSTTAASTVFGPIINGVPVNTDLPSILSDPDPFDPGVTISTSDGSWDGSQPITFTYQWQRSEDADTGFVPITGATDSSYVTVLDDAGWWLRAQVTATNSAGSAVAYSGSVQITPSQVVVVVPTSNWRWVLTNADGSPIRRIEANSRWYEKNIAGEPWSAGFTLTLSDDVNQLIDPGRTRLKVYRAAGVLEFHGKIWVRHITTDSAGDGTVEYTAWDALRQLEFDHATSTGIGSAIYKAADNETAWTIISDLIGRANGNATTQQGAVIRIGNRIGTGFSPKQRKFEGGTTILEALQSFIDTGDPVELVPRPVEGDIKTLTWPPGVQNPELVETMTLLDVYKRVGADSSAVFGYGKGPRNLISIEVDQDFATTRNRVIATGASVGKKTRTSTQQQDDALRSRYGLMEEFPDYSTIKSVDTLDEKAQGLLQALQPEITVVPGNNAPRLGVDFSLGDTVTVIAKLGSIELNQRVRVTRARVELDDDGYDKLTEISFTGETQPARATKPGERLTRRLRKMQDRIRELEQSNPAAITLTDDDETTRVLVDPGNGRITTYNADGSVRWQSP